MNDFFRRFAASTANVLGSPGAFMGAALLIALWAVTGPLFGFSDTWQLVINTLTTIVTFMMVFLIQNTQNRDAKAVHLKLDELIRSVRGARNGLVNLESLSDEELERLQREFEKLRRKAKDLNQTREQSRRAADGGAAPPPCMEPHLTQRTRSNAKDAKENPEGWPTPKG